MPVATSRAAVRPARRALLVSAVALVLVCALPTEVLADAPPTIAPSAPQVTVNEGNLAILFGSASDPDGGALTYSASMGSIEPSNQQPGSNWRWSAPGTDGPFDADVSVTARDSGGNTGNATFHFRVNNVPPEVSTKGPRYVPVSSKASREFSSRAFDRGVDTLTAQFLCGGAAPLTQQQGSSSSETRFTCSFGAPGDYQVGVHATDSDGDSSDAFMTTTATTRVRSVDDAYVQFIGQERNRTFGGRIAFVDLNGDGKQDLVSGNSQPSLYDTNDFAARSVFVLFGGPRSGVINTTALTAATGMRITGAARENGLGDSLAPAGDMNGDAVPDLVIGSTKSFSDTFKGAYVLYGHQGIGDTDLATMPASTGFRIRDSGLGAPIRVAGGGDVNGDGLMDVVVGTPNGPGAAYVIFGSRSRTTDVDLSLSPSTYGAKLFGTTYNTDVGSSLSLADVNRDALTDIVLGTQSAVRVVFGSRTLASSINVETMSASTGFTIDSSDIQPSTPVVAAGDVTGDGYADILAGVYDWNSITNDYRAQVLIYRGGSTPPTTPTARVIAPADVNATTFQSLAVGDWTADGKGDVVIGLAFASENGSLAGSAYVVPGSASPVNVFLETLGVWLRVDGNGPGHESATGVAVGDLDADGLPDLAVGSPRNWKSGWGRASLLEYATVDKTAPSVQAPTVDLRTSVGAVPKIKTRVLWPAATDPSGISKYELQMRKDGGSWQGVTLSNATATSINMDLSPASTYTFQLRATDKAGNRSGWTAGNQFTVRVVEENDPAIAWVGDFARVPLEGASGGYVKNAGNSKRSATLTFNGRAVAFVTVIGPNRGKAFVYLDGVLKTTLDLYSATEKRAWVGYWSKLTPGTHTIRVETTGDRNPSATNRRVDIDAFVYLT